MQIYQLFSNPVSLERFPGYMWCIVEGSQIEILNLADHFLDHGYCFHSGFNLPYIKSLRIQDIRAPRVPLVFRFVSVLFEIALYSRSRYVNNNKHIMSLFVYNPLAHRERTELLYLHL